jgi:hypothetical protein
VPQARSFGNVALDPGTVAGCPAGIPFGPAVLAAVLYRVFAFWLPIIPALAFLPLVPGLADDLARTPLQPAADPLARLAGEEAQGPARAPDAA